MGMASHDLMVPRSTRDTTQRVTLEAQENGDDGTVPFPGSSRPSPPTGTYCSSTPTYSSTSSAPPSRT